MLSTVHAVQPTRYRGSPRQNLAFRDQTAMLLALVASMWLLISAPILHYPGTALAGDAQLAEVVFGGWALLVAAWRFQRPVRRGSALLLVLFGGLMVGAPFYVGYGGAGGLLEPARIGDVTAGAVLVLCGLHGVLCARWAGHTAHSPEDRGPARTR